MAVVDDGSPFLFSGLMGRRVESRREVLSKAAAR